MEDWVCENLLSLYQTSTLTTNLFLSPGHTEARDEFIPRLIKTFDQANRGVKQVWCGGTFSLALDQNNLLYFWGQAKSSGEATMYPKNVQDLNGWNIRSVGCANKSIVVVADESVISWGPSPTYGKVFAQLYL